MMWTRNHENQSQKQQQKRKRQHTSEDATSRMPQQQLATMACIEVAEDAHTCTALAAVLHAGITSRSHQFWGCLLLNSGWWWIEVDTHSWLITFIWQSYTRARWTLISHKSNFTGSWYQFNVFDIFLTTLPWNREISQMKIVIVSFRRKFCL